MPCAHDAKRNVRVIMFGGEELHLDPAAAVYLPGHQTLVVADLHFEKGSALGRRGAPLPLYDTQETLTRLIALVEAYAPRQVVLLGDSFHDRQAWQRVPPDQQARLLALVAQIPTWWWLDGNHDAGLAQVLPGCHAAQLQLGGLQLAHQPIHGLAPLIVGHYHPKATRQVGGVKVRGKVFLHDERLLILPAFGSYTGGLAMTDAVYRDLLTAPTAYMAFRDRIWQVTDDIGAK